VSAGDRRRLWRAVSALGVAQIVSWGTLFYAIGVLGAPMRVALGVDDVTLFGSFTAGLFVSGIAAPAVGRRIDARGGRGVLAFGSGLAAVACAVLGASTQPWHMVAGWLIAGVAMAACLYDPAFAALYRSSGGAYRRAVTVLTLFGGFASTVFWPLSQYLLDTIGWRDAWYVYALLHAALCLPLHLAFAPRARSAGHGGEAAARIPPQADLHPHAFVWLAIALSLSAFLATALAAHLIGMLTAGGLAARDAVLVGSLIGPMQVAGRLMEMAIGSRLHARAVGYLAFGLMAVALLLLPWIGPVWILAMLFALVYGWSNGVMTIVRGTVPAELFGSRGYGELLGRLARPAFIAKAIAPVTLTFVFALDPQRRIAAATLAVGGVVALWAFSRAVRRA
jgi:MFS family permease